MNTLDIRAIRLYNQLLAGHTLNNPEAIVSWMGAMQAQTFPMAKWGIGVRLPGSTNEMIEKAINEDKIIRTHILRPTWHFVSSEDIHWMLELTAPRIKMAVLNYNKSLGEDAQYLSKMVRMVEKILEKEEHLTRQEIGAILQAEGEEMDVYRLNHTMMWAELEGVACNGRIKNNKQTYSLLHRKVKKTASLHIDEALERLARKYFTSHGPATLNDFVWWSGLRITDARKAIELIKDDFISEKIGEETYWFKNDIQLPPDNGKPSPLLLPAFDEFIVAYKGRTDILPEKHNRTIITKTGIFSPIITLNGEVIGQWKNATSGKAVVELNFFKKEKKQTENLFAPSIEKFKMFWGK